MIEFFQTYTTLTILLSGAFGLIIGSFFNVVIARYPKMLQQSWRQECAEFLNLPQSTTEKFNLLQPRSHCPHCQTTIPLWHNIPLLSFFLLRGKCHHCAQNISFIYPLVELLTMLLTMLIVSRYGISWFTLGAIVFTWGLITLSFIDIQTHILPDALTYVLLWLGLLANSFGLYTTPADAIIGAITGYVSLWIVGTLFKKILGKEAMGHGDYKMFAMLGAWLGMSSLLNVLLVAAISGLVINLFLIALGAMRKGQPISFGPFLAIAGWLTFIIGPFATSLINKLMM